MTVLPCDFIVFISCLIFDSLSGGHEYDDIELSDDDSRDSDDSNRDNIATKNRKKKTTGGGRDASDRDRIALKRERRGKTGRAPQGQVTAMLLQVVSSGKFFRAFMCI